jgi:hypothetical protein
MKVLGKSVLWSRHDISAAELVVKQRARLVKLREIVIAHHFGNELVDAVDQALADNDQYAYPDIEAALRSAAN